MIPKTQLTYPERMRYESLFGKFRPGEPVWRLTYPDEMLFQSRFGEFRPGGPAWRLTYPDEMLFQSLFGGGVESSPLVGEPVKVCDLLGEDLRALYEDCKNSPGGLFAMASPGVKVADVSPSGEVWDVQRKGERRAVAIPRDAKSSLQELADIVRLDADKALGESGWLRDAAWKRVDAFVPGIAYTVPNTLVLSVGDTSSLVIGVNRREVEAATQGISASFSGSSADAAAKARQFGLGTNYVVDKVGPVATLYGINSALASPDAAIWAHVGHGEPYPNMPFSEAALILSDKTPHPAADFKSHNCLALIIIYTCYGGKFSADDLLSEKGILLGTVYAMGERKIELDNWWNTQIKWQKWHDLPRKKRKGDKR